MIASKENILKALAHVIDPKEKKDIVTLDYVKDIRIQDDKIQLSIVSNNPTMQYKDRLKTACVHQIERFVGNKHTISIDFIQKPKETVEILPNVKNIIAIASGKGGVGKSTVSANIAAGLAKKGYKVGLLDADIYGPSVPQMFDVVQNKPAPIDVDGKQLIAPVESHGVLVNSIGFFSSPDQAVVWRGPMATNALKQLALDTHWGALDYLLIDLPPGTGDIHLSLVQTLPITGAVIVSTPQQIALIDAIKAVDMFNLKQINVPILGMTENMAYFTPEELPENKYYIFGNSGVKNLCEDKSIPFLGEIPIVQSIREAGDIGRPAILQENTPQAKAFDQVIDNLISTVNQRNINKEKTQPVAITHNDGCATA